MLRCVHVGDEDDRVIIIDNAVLPTVRSVELQNLFGVLGQEEEGLLVVLEEEDEPVIYTLDLTQDPQQAIENNLQYLIHESGSLIINSNHDLS